MGKQRTNTNISIDGALLSEARKHELNISAVSEKALTEAVQAARQKAWLDDNAEALEARRKWIEENGRLSVSRKSVIQVFRETL